MSWTGAVCGGAEHTEQPRCFGAPAPWHYLVPDSQFEQRVELTADQCVVDGTTFFVRGHIDIPVHGQAEPLTFSVWSSLSEASFRHMGERWESRDREQDAPYFGWLSTAIPAYPDTVHLQLSVQSRSPGLVPLFTVAPGDHALSIDQHQGISEQRLHEIVHGLLHEH